MSFLRWQVGEHGIYGRRRKAVKPLCDGFRKHRFHAGARTSVGKTCFLKPVTTENRSKISLPCLNPAAHVIPVEESA